MSKGGTRAEFTRSYSNDSSYDTSSVNILLDHKSNNVSRNRKYVICLGVSVTFFAFLLCIVLLSSKPSRPSNLVKPNNTFDRNNSSSTKNISQDTLTKNQDTVKVSEKANNIPLEPKLKELVFKSDEILKQLKLLGGDVRRTSNQISNLDSTVEAHQGEFISLKSKVDDIHTKITALNDHLHNIRPFKNEAAEEHGNSTDTFEIKLQMMHKEIQGLNNSMSLMEIKFDRINEKVDRMNEKFDRLMNCIENNTIYRPVDDIIGQARTTEKDAEDCQKRCASTNGCSYFTFWHDGGCHLSSSSATKENCAKTNSCHMEVSGGPKECHRLSEGTHDSEKDNKKMQMMEKEILQLKNAVALLRSSLPNFQYDNISTNPVCQRIDVNTGCVKSATTLNVDGISSFVCPAKVDKNNWLSKDTYKDTFAITLNGDSITATRTDSGAHGWCLHLSFQCCKELNPPININGSNDTGSGQTIVQNSTHTVNTNSNSSPHLLQIRGIVAIDEHESMKFGTENAVDNNVDTFFHTSSANGGIGYAYPWVRMDLVNRSIVERVVITNRKGCCGDRLHNLEVRVGYSKVLPSERGAITDNILCSNYEGPGSDGEVITVECTEPIMGKYVTLQLMYDPAILNFAEVAIHGTECQCKDLVSPSGHGNCLKGHDKTGGKQFCYVVQPSSCSDLQDSTWNGGEKYSAVACTN